SSCETTSLHDVLPIWNSAHEVAGGQHRAVAVVQLLGEVGHAMFLVGMELVPPVAGHRLAAQFGPGGGGPHLGGQAPVHGEQMLGYTSPHHRLPGGMAACVQD